MPRESFEHTQALELGFDVCHESDIILGIEQRARVGKALFEPFQEHGLTRDGARPSSPAAKGAGASRSAQGRGRIGARPVAHGTTYHMLAPRGGDHPRSRGNTRAAKGAGSWALARVADGISQAVGEALEVSHVALVD